MKKVIVVILTVVLSLGFIPIKLPTSSHAKTLDIQSAAAQTSNNKSSFLSKENSNSTHIDNKTLYINELRIKNKAGDEDGWLELYNSSNLPANLRGYYLSNDVTNLRKWQLPNMTIGPGELLLIWTSTKAIEVSSKELKTDFEISSNDKSVILTKPDGTTIEDQLSLASVPDGMSLGRFPDGSGSLRQFSSPTRNRSNNNNFSNNAPGKPGIAITWDDDSIEEWHNLLSFKWYRDIKTTFALTQPYRLSEDKWEKLRDLKRHGHEIASHAYRHENALHYIKSNGMQAYIDSELLSSISLMTSKGLAPTSFVYPYGVHNNATNSALLKYFKAVRVTSYSHGGDLFIWGSTKVIPANGMDSNYPYAMEDYYKWLEKAKNSNQVVVLYGHIPTSEPSGNYRTPHQRLELIIKKAKELNLTFYTLSELSAEVGTLKVDLSDNLSGSLQWTLDRKTWYSQGSSIMLPAGDYMLMVRGAEKHDIKYVKIENGKTNVIRLANP